MARHEVQAFEENNSANVGFNEHLCSMNLATTVGNFVSNCTRKAAGIYKVVVYINEKDDRQTIDLTERVVQTETKSLNKMDEQVLVFAASALKTVSMDGEKGMLFGTHNDFLSSKEYVETLQFKRRGDAEEDELFKQPIPYWVIVNPAGG